MRKYAYCRVSTDEQGVSGIGLAHQRAASLKMGERIPCLWGTELFPDAASAKKGVVCTEPGFFVDVVSAYRTPFVQRPAGRALVEILDPGDTIIFSRLDRGFRSVMDFCSFIKLAQQNEWNVVCQDPPLDLSTPYGRMQAKFYVLVSEWYSDFNSIRVKEALAAKKERGGLLEQERPEMVTSLPSEYRPTKKVVLPADLTPAMPPGRIFVYIRCSHRTSAESGLGLRHQMTAGCRYADMLSQQYPTLEWKDEIYTDAAVSALSIGMFNRPNGRKLNEVLRSGDVVVCLRPDRIFGSVRDMSETLVDWSDRGVSLHFVDGGGMSMSTPAGQMAMNAMVAFSQFERQLASARAKESRAILESEGKFTGGRNGHYPPFYRMAMASETLPGEKKTKKSRRLVIDRKQISTFMLIERLGRRIGIKNALIRVEELIAKRENRPPIPEHGVQKKGRWANVPRHYVPDRNGNIWPMWTRRRFNGARESWPTVQAEWRRKAQEERDALRKLSDETEYQRHYATAFRGRRRYWDNVPEKPRQAVAQGVG